MKDRLIPVAALLAALIFAPSAGAVGGHGFGNDGQVSGKIFWTPQRVNEALNRDPVFARTSPGNQLRHRPVTVNRPEVGKILGWDRRGGYSCTGSVIDTASLRLVLTAAHCVLANGIWARRMVFIPDFRNGRRPFGTYSVRTAWVANWWQRLSFGSFGANFDIAILVTRKTANGSRVGQIAGAIPVRAFPNRRALTDIYGYPAAAMRGRVMRTCRSRTIPDF